jgi:hypothetical protein
MFMNDQQTQHEKTMLDMWAGCQDSGKASRETVGTWLRLGGKSSATALSMITVIDFRDDYTYTSLTAGLDWSAAMRHLSRRCLSLLTCTYDISNAFLMCKT